MSNSHSTTTGVACTSWCSGWTTNRGRFKIDWPACEMAAIFGIWPFSIVFGDLGMPIELEELAEEGGDGSVGRPHIAAVMMAHGYVPDIRTAFDAWLGAGKPAYVPRERLDT